MKLSGERFAVVYRLTGDQTGALAKAEDICLEQTVEFPAELVPAGFIKSEVLGRIEEFTAAGDGVYLAMISYAVELAAGELTQLLNVIYGNISIKPGIRVESLQLPAALLDHFRGPRFGRAGLRRLLKTSKRPLLATAIKPMGLSAVELADLAYKCALGGIDIIKDDHGLSNQCFAPFDERVKACADAVARANRETGGSSIYVANITAGPLDIIRRAAVAKNYGAGGLLVAPALVGLDTMRFLADDDSLGLPIISHPAFQGSYVIGGDSGLSHYVLYGQLARLAGADATIYPNFGGRFSFSKEECISIVAGTAAPMENVRSVFPCPGGGMSLAGVPELLEVYGQDVIFLIGGGLFKHGPDLVANCRYFRDLVEKATVKRL
jgi:ribulose-bisphosphate carboxylase large chain